MKNKDRDIIVFDLEWNQASSKNLIKGNLTGEIIQIGAIKLDMRGNMTDFLALDIKPSFYKSINRYVGKVTHIKNSDLKNGLEGKKALSLFSKWCGKNFLLVSWGPDDSHILKQNYEIYDLDSEWFGKVYNSQLLFSKTQMGDSTQRSLVTALEYYGLKPKVLHNALSDAYETVRVINKIGVEKLLNDW